MFLLGDFYEIFKQDAEWGAKLLGIGVVIATIALYAVFW